MQPLPPPASASRTPPAAGTVTFPQPRFDVAGHGGGDGEVPLGSGHSNERPPFNIAVTVCADGPLVAAGRAPAVLAEQEYCAGHDERAVEASARVPSRASKSVTVGVPLDVGIVAVVGVWKTGVPDGDSFVNTSCACVLADMTRPVMNIQPRQPVVRRDEEPVLGQNPPV